MRNADMRRLYARVLLQRDRAPSVRAAALRAASRLATRQGVSKPDLEDLRPLLDDESPEVRTVVLRGLTARAQTLEDGLLDSVIAALADTHPGVATASGKAFRPLAVR